MTINRADNNTRPEFDTIIQQIADYALAPLQPSNESWQTAAWCLLDSLGCAMLALQQPVCRRMLGPIVPGTTVENGAKVPGTDFFLDPVQAAFNLGTMIRWLDYNDTWLAAEWGHPSDNFGAIIMVADYLNRIGQKEQKAAITIKEVLLAAIKAYEIQGVMALKNSFNRVGLDHVVLVKAASTAVVTAMLGGDKNAICTALSHVFVDGQSLRTYRHAPNTGSRKSWAAGDATSRAVRLALITQAGEPGYPSCLTAPTWGFYAVSFANKAFELPQDFNDSILRNILFKVSYPAEYHAQTAVEAAVRLHPEVSKKLDDIERIEIETQEPGVRIISKTGPLHNPADRDHCLQYMVAIALLYGDLQVCHYEDEVAASPRVDQLRDKMQVSENERFSKDYLDPNKRAFANAIQVFYQDGSSSEKITVEFPLGHQQRREEALPHLKQKCRDNLASHLATQKVDQLVAYFDDVEVLQKLTVSQFIDLFDPA